MALAQSDFSYISTIVRQRAAIVLEPGKEYLVESRLTPLAQAEGKGSIAELVSGLQADRSGRLLTKVVDAMTTNETLFFRDGHPFETLRTTLLPQLLEARRATGRLDIWCGASSSGQEPYSISMILKELAPSYPGVRTTLLATDVNDKPPLSANRAVREHAQDQTMRYEVADRLENLMAVDVKMGRSAVLAGVRNRVHEIEERLA